MNNGKQRAFTLIELLVVIVVIGMLLGMIFKMMQYAKRNADKAQAVSRLEMLGQALSEYKAEYGHYPPTSTNYYEFENTLFQTPWLRDNYLASVTNSACPLFRYGLVAYLWPRSPVDQPGRTAVYHWRDAQWKWDDERAQDAKTRWSVFLADVPRKGYSQTEGSGIYYNGADWGAGTDSPYWNDRIVIVDPWDNLIHYKSTPPYLTYELWSSGIGGVPIHKKTWDD